MVGTLFMAPFKVLGWIVKHPRILILFVILIFGFFAFRACTGVFSKGIGGNSSTSISSIKTAEYQSIAPTIKQAPYVISTATRIYYVSKYQDKDNIVTLQQFYTYDKDTWIVRNQPLKLDRKYYGVITIYKR